MHDSSNVRNIQVQILLMVSSLKSYNQISYFLNLYLFDLDYFMPYILAPWSLKVKFSIWSQRSIESKYNYYICLAV